MFKNKFVLIALLALALVLPTSVKALDFRIELGDRPYYTRGARYWDGDWEYVWIPGHRYRGHWIHGHYRRGEFRRHHHRYHGRFDDHHHRDRY